jgi:hypothetical protein
MTTTPISVQDKAGSLAGFGRAVCLNVLTATALLMPMAGMAQSSFQFGVAGHAFANNADDAVLRRVLADSDGENLAFLIVNGIKASSEPCSDSLYEERRDLLQTAQHGVVVALAASDWVSCRNQSGNAAIERLNRLREILFTDEFSLGATRIPLLRQSLMPQFRSYAENARWEFGDILFATINIPVTNNHFVQEGGRNGEFEDRLIANKDWLQRLFKLAAQRRLPGIVLFCDGNPLTQPGQRPFLLHGQRDGFAEMRLRINQLAAGYHGKVLLIHGENLKSDPSANGIVWHHNLGSLGVASGWARLKVDNHSATLFALVSNSKTGKNNKNRKSAPITPQYPASHQYPASPELPQSTEQPVLPEQSQ